MPRRSRGDAPGAFFHVYHRGIAKRTVFETRADVRYFLSLLARESRRGTIRIHAYAFLTTHFHLLVESPRGELSAAMRRVLNRYVRWFNHRRERDGALFRGRFGSRRVRSETSRIRVVRYIDLNAPRARLAHDATTYPYGSAFHFRAGRRPRWLEASWVDRAIGTTPPARRAEAYRATFGGTLRDGDRFLVERASSAAEPVTDPAIPDLIDAAPESVLAWMRHKTWLADGTRPGAAVADPETVERWVANWPSLPIPAGKSASPKQVRVARESIRVGALWTLARLTQEEIAARTGLSAMQVRVRLVRFRRSFRSREPAMRPAK